LSKNYFAVPVPVSGQIAIFPPKTTLNIFCVPHIGSHRKLDLGIISVLSFTVKGGTC